jgi:selenocysteine-specific translation elongation factor
VIALNKVDKAGAREIAHKLRNVLEPLNPDVWVISAAEGEGLQELKDHLVRLVEASRQADPDDVEGNHGES